MTVVNQTTTLGDAFISISNGLNVKQDRVGSGLPISRIETIATGFVNPARCGFADIEVGTVDRWMLNSGDILFSHINSPEQVGKCALIEESGLPLVHGMNLLRLVPDIEVLDPKYAMYTIRSPDFRSQLRPFINQAVNQASVSIRNLKTLPFPLPPLPEQRRIAAILDKTDHLRTQRREALAHLDALTRSIFNNMFGDPVSNSSGWPTAKLSTLGGLDRGVSKHRPRNDPKLLTGSHPLIQTGDVANSGGYITGFKSTYSDLGLSQSKIWPTGTLCITIAANIAKTGILTFDACFPDSVVGFTADESTVVFVQVWMGFLQKIIENNAPESAQKNINLAILRNLDVIAPPLELQQTFARRVAVVERLKARHRTQLTELDTLFASLQHRAFRGEL